MYTLFLIPKTAYESFMDWAETENPDIYLEASDLPEHAKFELVAVNVSAAGRVVEVLNDIAPEYQILKRVQLTQSEAVSQKTLQEILAARV